MTRLNGLVVSALLAHGLPAVSVHPFPQWRKRRNVMRRGAATCADVVRCWRAGLLPVLHGDAVFDGVPRLAFFSSSRADGGGTHKRSPIDRTQDTSAVAVLHREYILELHLPDKLTFNYRFFVC